MYGLEYQVQIHCSFLGKTILLALNGNEDRLNPTPA